MDQQEQMNLQAIISQQSDKNTGEQMNILDQPMDNNQGDMGGISDQVLAQNTEIPSRYPQ